MTERGWWMDAKIYELYVDKFAKDLKGLTARLEYFGHLGINTLHILPHYPSPMVDDGYDISDYENVRPALGSLEDFTAFTKAAHERGIHIIADLVINHVSSQHPWFLEARSSRNNPMRDFFIWSETGTELKNAPNPFIDFKPSNWIRNEATGDYYYATFYPEQPDLNWDNLRVLEEILVRIDFWVERGVDGFRLDAIPYLVEREDTSSFGLPETHRIIAAIRAHLDKKYDGRIALLAEIGAAPEEAKKYLGAGDECQMVYNFPLTTQLFRLLARQETGEDVQEIVRQSSHIPENCIWAVFLRNHDDLSFVGISESERVELLNFLDPGHRYLFNKGHGTSVRLSTIFSGNEARIIEAFKLLYSLPGAPILYYGDEIGMQNLPFQKDIVDTRRYVRGEFDWATAEAMRMDHTSLLNSVAQCIRNHDLR